MTEDTMREETANHYKAVEGYLAALVAIQHTRFQTESMRLHLECEANGMPADSTGELLSKMANALNGTVSEILQNTTD